MWFVGIDPGKQGGLGAVDHEGEVAGFWPMPTIPAEKKKILGGLATKTVKKEEYDIEGIMALLADYQLMRTSIFFVEAQQPMPAGVSHGGTAEFWVGLGYGMWIGFLSYSHAEVRYVWPRDWQSQMLAKVEGDDLKKRSVEAAELRWPGQKFLRTPRSRKSHHGITDAILIGEYGRLCYQKGEA